MGSQTRSGGGRGELAAVAMALLGCFAAALAVVLLLVALPSGGLSADSGTPVTRTEMGDRWPLKVPTGLLRCERGSEITFQADGTTYSLDGRATHAAYGDIGPLLLEAGDLAPLLERGSRLCG